jgi:DNA-binding NarL/FixJ family response regulator
MTTDLSVRERQVVGLLAEGWTHKDIALVLTVGQETVKEYARRARAKLRRQGVWR